jgi:nitric oxide reductase large subunit
MKKFTVFIVMVIFIVFVYLGYQAAANLKTQSAVGSVPANAATALASTQQNVLLVHVDDLAQAKPKLISVWGFFAYYSTPNQVVFLPLLPSFDPTVQSTMMGRFSLDKNRQVSRDFITALQQKFNIKVTGVVVTDNTGLSFFTSQLTGQTEPVLAAPAETDEQKRLVLTNATFFFQTTCTSVLNKSGDVLTNLDWKQLAPDHFSTTLPFETIMVDRQKLFSSDAVNQCVVLGFE